jgi:von Willebrand factor A domain-containing protein 8
VTVVWGGLVWRHASRLAHLARRAPHCGAGKNKLVDQLLQVARCEREYVQLHRDTTISALTATPTLKDGRVVWEDSPLVRAARWGRALVVDEVDKAPSEVTSVLRGLVEDGEMLLGDGRRLVDPQRCPGALAAAAAGQTIPVHPNFRIFALANRPGWPFLGNNVIASGLAACFATHWIENADAASELQLARSYGGSVHDAVLRSLVGLFADLRRLHADGEVDGQTG